MTEPRDFLPTPPWKGPPIPGIMRKAGNQYIVCSFLYGNFTTREVSASSREEALEIAIGPFAEEAGISAKEFIKLNGMELVGVFTKDEYDRANTSVGNEPYYNF